MYKIKRLSDSLYSKGGTSPFFSKTGKTWRTLAHVRSHIRHIQDYMRGERKSTYHDCVIEEYEMKLIRTSPIQGIIDDIKNRKAQQEEVEDRRVKSRQDKEDLEEFERLKRKLGK